MLSCCLGLSGCFETFKVGSSHPKCSVPKELDKEEVKKQCVKPSYLPTSVTYEEALHQLALSAQNQRACAATAEALFKVLESCSK